MTTDTVPDGMAEKIAALVREALARRYLPEGLEVQLAFEHWGHPRAAPATYQPGSAGRAASEIAAISVPQTPKAGPEVKTPDTPEGHWHDHGTSSKALILFIAPFNPSTGRTP